MSVLGAVGAVAGKIGGALASNIGNLASAGVSLWNATKNRHSQENMNRQNLAAAYYTNAQQMQRQDEQLAYQKALNEQIFQREDTAMERGVASALNAGLSPLEANPAAASAGAGATVSGYSPALAQVTAPQMDLSGMIGALANIDQINAQKKIAKLQSDTSKDVANLQKDIAVMRCQADMSMCQANIANTANIAQGQLDEQARQFNVQQNNDMLKMTQQLELQYNQLNSMVEEKNLQAANDCVRSTVESIKNWSQSAGVPVNFKTITIKSDADMKRLEQLNAQFDSDRNAGYKAYNAWINSPERTPDEVNQLYSRSKGFNRSGGANAGVNVFGSGGSAGMNLSEGEQSSETMQRSAQKEFITMQEFYPKTLTYYVPSFDMKYYKR